MSSFTTTILEYRSYNFTASSFRGTQPYTYFETQSVPLFGVPGVRVSFRLYPFGDKLQNQGFVGGFIMFYGDGCEPAFVRAKGTLTIGNVTHTIGVHHWERSVMCLWQGLGFPQHMGTSQLLQARDVFLSFRLDVIEVIRNIGGVRAREDPADGQRVYELYSY